MSVRQMIATPKLPICLNSQFSRSKIGRMNHSNQPQSIALDSFGMPSVLIAVEQRLFLGTGEQAGFGRDRLARLDDHRRVGEVGLVGAGRRLAEGRREAAIAGGGEGGQPIFVGEAEPAAAACVNCRPAASSSSVSKSTS